MSAGYRGAENQTITVFSDAKSIYLPDTIGHYPEKNQNEALFKYLVKIEAGLHEFGTFDFDLEKLEEKWPYGGDCFSDFEKPSWALEKDRKKKNLSDLESFFPCSRYRNWPLICLPFLNMAVSGFV